MIYLIQFTSANVSTLPASFRPAPRAATVQLQRGFVIRLIGRLANLAMTPSPLSYRLLFFFVTWYIATRERGVRGLCFFSLINSTGDWVVDGGTSYNTAVFSGPCWGTFFKTWNRESGDFVGINWDEKIYNETRSRMKFFSKSEFTYNFSDNRFDYNSCIFGKI